MPAIYLLFSLGSARRQSVTRIDISRFHDEISFARRFVKLQIGMPNDEVEQGEVG